jgi:xylulokinase
LTICKYHCPNKLDMDQYLLGLDIGSSSVKASIVSVTTGKKLGASQSPMDEMPMLSLKNGWAEQDPEMWWRHTVTSIRQAISTSGVDGNAIEAIGISYQMHGLVVVDKNQVSLRPSIIWCDSRAVEIGEKANKALGSHYCLKHYLNSPGNFTASKLRWMRENEPHLFEKIHKIMLPGDYIAMRLTGEIATTSTGLSEGIFWDFESESVAERLLQYYQFDKALLPDIVPVFSNQGEITKTAQAELGLKKGCKVTYRAGDQPNNAFSLNVLKAGETAATAGTSGVIYSVTDKNAYDDKSRVNTFIHPSTNSKKVNGVLLCVNGTGILNSWVRKSTSHNGNTLSYPDMNSIAERAPIGSGGLRILPFGNGAERILENRSVNASFHNLDFNHHNQSHFFRAAQEGIVFALKYGFDILGEMGLKPSVIRAGKANMFLSKVFQEAFVNTTQTALELYDTDGAKGAAIGAGVGAGIFKNFTEAFAGLTMIESVEVEALKVDQYQEAYHDWKTQLNTALEEK